MTRMLSQGRVDGDRVLHLFSSSPSFALCGAGLLFFEVEGDFIPRAPGSCPRCFEVLTRHETSDRWDRRVRAGASA